MSSSLVSVGSVGASVSARTGVEAAAPKTLMDVFASLLAGVDAGAEIRQSSTATVNGVDLVGTGRDVIRSLLQGDGTTSDADVSVTGLADLLLKAEARVEAGESIDAETLKKLKAGLDALATLLSVSGGTTGGVMVGTNLSGTGGVMVGTDQSTGIGGLMVDEDQSDLTGGVMVGTDTGIGGVMVGTDPSTGTGGVMVGTNGADGTGGVMVGTNGTDGTGGVMVGTNGTDGIGGVMVGTNATDGTGGVMVGTDASTGTGGIMVATDPATGIGGVMTTGIDPALIKDLAEKLRLLGEKMGGVDGELSQKLTALATKVASLEMSIEDLLKAAPELKTVIEALTKTKIETTVTTVTPDLAMPELKLPANTSIDAKGSATDVSADLSGRVETPGDGDAIDPKVELKANVKADLSSIAAAPDKRDVPALMTVNQQAPDATVAAATTAAGTHAGVNGEVRAVHTAYQLPAAINLPHMAFEIAKQVQQGVSKFQIRLDPPELGRIDVKLDMDQSGQVNAKLVVERSETLDLLQRDQRALERALAQAGLDAGKTNLEFSLKQNPFAGQDGRDSQQAGSPFGDTRAPVIHDTEPIVAATVYRGTASAAGVNIFV